MNFGERVEFLLKSKGIKQAALADELGLRRQTFSEWKNGNKMPSAESAIKLAQKLDVSLDFLLTGENKEDAGIVLSEDEEELLKNYRELTTEIKTIINIQVSALAVKKNK